MDDRGFSPELTVFATNRWIEGAPSNFLSGGVGMMLTAVNLLSDPVTEKCQPWKCRNAVSPIVGGWTQRASVNRRKRRMRRCAT